MSIPTIISLVFGKIIGRFGGTALPGLVGLKLCPGLINQIAEKNNLSSVVITGTNGKTSTARLLGAVLTEKQISFISNSSGSNLLRGIATCLINQTGVSGKLKPKIAVWEVDEAAVPAAVTALRPKIIVITNISRDQLDRFGEIDSLLTRWQKSLDSAPPETAVLVNAADRRLKVLRHPNLTYFGSARPGFGLTYPGKLAGKFNRDNLWAVAAICRCLKINRPRLMPTALAAAPAFGRGEVFPLNGCLYQINLVKNPASLKAVWQMLAGRRHLRRPLLLALNDNLADGTDVSWIWDAPFIGISRRRRAVIVSGRRAADLALRLKYAGLSPHLIKVEPNIGRACRRLQSQPGSPKYILPTYTAMLELRHFFKRPKWN